MTRRRRDDQPRRRSERSPREDQVIEALNTLCANKDWSVEQLALQIEMILRNLGGANVKMSESTLRPILKRQRPPSPRSLLKLTRFILHYDGGRHFK